MTQQALDALLQVEWIYDGEIDADICCFCGCYRHADPTKFNAYELAFTHDENCVVNKALIASGYADQAQRDVARAKLIGGKKHE
jgi:hypothetical protein